MAAVRKRRSTLGLVQMNLWIREEDRDAFAQAVAPFRTRAGQIDKPHQPGRKPREAAQKVARLLDWERRAGPASERPRKPVEPPAAHRVPPRPRLVLPCRLAFSTAPPASVRNAMKAEGWTYDKLTGLWSIDSETIADAWLPELIGQWHGRIAGAMISHAKP